jgi:hypothetical protein
MSKLTGFDWPPSATGAPRPSKSVVSLSSSVPFSSMAPDTPPMMSHKPAITSGSGAPAVNILPIVPSKPTMTSGSGAPPVSIPFDSQPAASSHAGSKVATETPGPRTVLIQITQTITILPMPDTTVTHSCTQCVSSCTHKTGIVTATAALPVLSSSKPFVAPHPGHSDGMVMAPQVPTMVRPAAVSVTDAPQHTSVVHVTQTIAKARTADVTDVAFKLYEPSSNEKINEPGAASNKAITGAIIGSVCFVVLFILFCAIRRKKFKYGGKGKQSTAEKGQAGRRVNRTTDDWINEAHRCRQERNRRIREQANRSAATQAPNIEMAKLCGPVANGHSSINRPQLAESQGWDTSIRRADSQSRALLQPAHMPAAKPALQPPPNVVVEPPTPAHHRSHQAERRSNSPVSPLSDTFGPIRAPANRTYDVSPPDSPGGNGRNG